MEPTVDERMAAHAAELFRTFSNIGVSASEQENRVGGRYSCGLCRLTNTPTVWSIIWRLISIRVLRLACSNFDRTTIFLTAA